MKFLKESEYFLLHKRFSGGHWKPNNLIWRWAYHAAAISVAKGFEIGDASKVLEIGTAGISIVDGSHTLDHPKMYDFPGKRPTYAHDARNVPWPIAEKRYEVTIALRMFQHISPFQQACFLEAKRVSKKLLIVVPQFYDFRKHGGASGIHYAEFYQWNDQVHPNLFIRFRTEDMYVWDFETPSQINLFYDSIAKPIQSYEAPNKKIVEIVGPNAVGKSSLKDNIIKQNYPRFKIIEQKILSQFCRVPEIELKGSIKELIFEKYKTLKSSGHTKELIQRSIAHSIRVIGNEFMMDQIGLNSVILIDDGMLTNFSSQIDTLQAHKEGLIGKRNLVIVLNVSKDNLLKRRSENPNATPYRGLDGSELELKVEKVIEFFQGYSERLREAGYAVVDIDGDLTLAEQCSLVMKEMETIGDDMA